MTPEGEKEDKRRPRYEAEPANPSEPDQREAEGPPPLEDNTELGAAEVFPEREPGATQATYAAQTGDRSRYPGSVPDKEREEAREEEAERR